MKGSSRRFAPVGLALAALGLLVCLGVLVVKGLVAAGLYLPRDPQLINTIGLVAAAVTLLGLSLFAILDPERTRALLTGRQARHGSNAFLMLVAFFGILVFLNVIAYENPQSWDVSADKQNTLAPETLDTLAALPEPVTAVAFYSAQSSPDFAQELLEKYKQASAGKFEYTIVDPDAEPARAVEAGITQDGTIALYLGQQKQLVDFADEQAITSALVRLINPEKRGVYFLTGHGERDIENAGESSYTTARTVLESKNYTVETLNLLEAEQVPLDADTVIIAGPQVSLSEDEVSRLQDYLAGGGTIIAMAEPVLLTEMGDEADLLAEMLSTDWSISLAKDIVFDPSVSQQGLFTATVATGAHPITDPIQNIAVIYPSARSLVVGAEAAGPSVTDLGSTGDAAWGDNNYSPEDQEIAYDEGVDTPGPLQIAAAAENSETGGRVVVFGDADFADDTYYQNFANLEMFINAVDWAAGEEQLIGLTSYGAEERTFQPPGTLAGNALIVFSACLLPLAIVVAGVWVWLAHRRRG